MRRFLPWLALLGLVVLVQWLWGWGTVLAPWATLSPGALALAVVLVFASYAVRALRLFDYFRAAMRGRFLAAFRLMLLHNLFNNLLPMRAGEVSFPVLMAREFRVAAVQSIPALLWFRLLDLHTVLALGGAAALALGALPAWLWVGWLGWMGLPWLAFRLQAGWLTRLAHAGDGRAGALAQKALTGLPADARGFWRSWAWTGLNWGVKIGVFAWVLLQFAPLPPLAGVVGAIGGDLTSVLPIHAPGGFGTFEAGVAAGVAAAGVVSEAVVPAAINLHLFVLGASMASGGLAVALSSVARARGTG